MDYCGSIGTEWVPEWYGEQCRLHDQCYESLYMTKNECDLLFLNNMYHQQPLFFPVAFIFFLGVVLFGRKSYIRAQNAIKGTVK